MNSSPSSPTNRIEVEGDVYTAAFHLPPGTAGDGAHARLVMLPAGANYIHAAIRFLHPLLHPTADSIPIHFRAPPQRLTGLFCHINQDHVGWYEVRNTKVGSSETKVLRTHGEARVLRWHVGDHAASAGLPGSGSWAPPPEDLSTGAERAVLVQWHGNWVLPEQKKVRPASPRSCGVQIQVGLAYPLGSIRPDPDRETIRPEHCATPSLCRVVVVNLAQIAERHRVRMRQSYEAIAVDLLRYLRGDAKAPAPAPGGVLTQLSFEGDHAAINSILLVRLNDSAVFLYYWTRARQEEAWILYHKEQPAPLELPEHGRMLGCTGFVSATFAAAAQHWAFLPPGPSCCAQAVKVARWSLVLQRAAFRCGLGAMLLGEAPHERAYEAFFEAVMSTLLGPRTASTSSLLPRSEGFISALAAAEREIVAVRVDIEVAVAHRTQWFMARSMVTEHAHPTRINTDALRNLFLSTATGWLSGDAKRDPRSPDGIDVPVVPIGDLILTDRREVEDFLAIHQALELYGRHRERNPLSIAVFGAPGSGKSFGVNEVVKYISRQAEDVFDDQLMEFNVGQFKSPEDLPAALHLARNQCLSGRIPVVFFDEFDASQDGASFGWLKHFLAPMQDGKFYHKGATYKIGPAVFVFAGGVNRSFEEFNGRLRNPGFCEAKGPDFISRLKAHLNIQGVNRPEDDGDQGRFVLRRGVMLHSMVRKRRGLGPHDRPRLLLRPSVAKALLTVDRFKHGVRSLEAIVKMCALRGDEPIGPSDLPSMEQLEMHVDAAQLLHLVDTFELQEA